MKVMVVDARSNGHTWRRGPKTLVVEEDEAVASMICLLLEEEGFACLQTGRAEDAWNTVTTEALRAAIIDLRLPGRDGWWLLRKIRGDELTQRLPIVLITGFLDDEVEIRAAELGCECLAKPFSFPELATTLLRAEALVQRIRAQA